MALNLQCNIGVCSAVALSYCNQPCIGCRLMLAAQDVHEAEPSIWSCHLSCDAAGVQTVMRHMEGMEEALNLKEAELKRALTPAATAQSQVSHLNQQLHELKGGTSLTRM